MSFKELGLCEEIMQAIKACRYKKPTAIQSQVVPVVMRGKDVIGIAKTGTGKTAAFVWPILERLNQHQTRRKFIKALILTPTRELAKQIEEAVETYGQAMDIKAVALYGGVSMTKQQEQLEAGVDIAVATPGRLEDHIQRHSVNLHSIEVLVIDEADRMFDMGFIQDVYRILQILPRRRQSMLFSATLPDAVKNLASKALYNPKTIQIGKQSNPIATIRQHMIQVEPDRKLDLLLHLLENTHIFSALVFCSTKDEVAIVHRRLTRARISSDAIHADRTQRQRQTALEKFRALKVQVLVATDVAARGIDVEGVSHVINMTVPHAPQEYIHRIGRTGRAGEKGDAITFVSYGERRNFSVIEQHMKLKVHEMPVEDFDFRSQPDPDDPAGEEFLETPQAVHPLARSAGKKKKPRKVNPAPKTRRKRR